MFRTRASAAVLVAVVAAGCGSAGQPAPYDSTGIDELEIPSPSPEGSDFVGVVDNPWLSWDRGQVREFTVSDGGREVGTMTVSVADESVRVGGLESFEVTEVVDVKGAQRMESRGWYAQDHAGNVWWLAGAARGATWSIEDGDPAGLLLPASPRVGDGWVAVERPGAREDVRVEQATSLEGDAGAWERVVVLRHDADARQRRYYAEGVGLVRVVDLGTGHTMEMDEPPAR